MIVLDTNIVLDLLVFKDPATLPLQQALQARRLRWIATAAMREELSRVLAYPQIVPRLAYYQLGADAVLAAFDRQALRVETAPRVAVVCKDPDDQKFIDLAVAHRARLLSKDHAVLRLRKRLQALGVLAAPALEPPVLEATEINP
jgi:putative PIN family toxin of toxin-antitoxin system